MRTLDVPLWKLQAKPRDDHTRNQAKLWGSTGADVDSESFGCPKNIEFAQVVLSINGVPKKLAVFLFIMVIINGQTQINSTKKNNPHELTKAYSQYTMKE